MASPVNPVQQLVKRNEFLEIVRDDKGSNKHFRVKCTLTQHEMLPRVDVIEQHLKSKKFVKARDWYSLDYSQYEPYIVPHRKLPKNLFCNVTGTILNRIPSELEKHVQGKRYKRMKQHVEIKTTKSEFDDDDLPSTVDVDINAFENGTSLGRYSDDEDGQGDSRWNEVPKAKKDEQVDDLADLYPAEDFVYATNDIDGNHGIKDQFKKKRAANNKTTRQRTKKAKSKM